LIKLGVPIEKDDHQQAWYNERVYFNIASKTFYSKERQLSFTDQAIVTQEKTTDGPMRTMPARALISRSFRRGGIDLNPAQMSMQVKTVGEDFKFDFNGTEIDAAQVTGVTFTIRQMTPVTDLPQILGLTRHSSI